MTKVFEPDWGAEDADGFDEFSEKFRKTFPNFVLTPNDIYAFWAKNERASMRGLSLTPKQDRQLEDCITRLEELCAA